MRERGSDMTFGDVIYILIRWLIIAASLVVAAWIVPGIDVTDTNGWLAVLVTAAVLGRSTPLSGRSCRSSPVAASCSRWGCSCW